LEASPINSHPSRAALIGRLHQTENYDDFCVSVTLEQTTLPLPTLSALTGKKIDARFDGGRLSSDGGVVLLSEADRRLGMSGRLAGCIVDERDQTLVRHSMRDLVRARSFAIAAGFEDGNDFALLRRDPRAAPR
jgi:hypothetical protein